MSHHIDLNEKHVHDDLQVLDSVEELLKSSLEACVQDDGRGDAAHNDCSGNGTGFFSSFVTW